MLKRSVYETYMKNHLKACCSERVWYNWKLSSPGTKKNPAFDVLMPDVSRIFRRPYDISSDDFDFVNSLFNRKRKTNL